MIIRTILTVALSLTMAFSSNANNTGEEMKEENVINSSEEPETVQQRRPFRRPQDLSNTWLFGASAGLQTYFGDHNKQQDIVEGLSLHNQFYFGYWITNTFGLRANLQGFTVKGLTQNDAYSTGPIIDIPNELKKQRFNYLAGHVEALFNLTPYIYEKRKYYFYNIVPYAGLGLAANISKPNQKSLSMSAGLLNTFALNQNLDFIVDLRGAIVSDKFDGEVGERRGEGPLSVSLGLSFKFKQGY